MKKTLTPSIKILLLILFITTNFLVNRSALAMYPNITTYNQSSYPEKHISPPSPCTKTLKYSIPEYYSSLGEKSDFIAYLNKVKFNVTRSVDSLAFSLFSRAGYLFDTAKYHKQFEICYEVSTNKNACDTSKFKIQAKGRYVLKLNTKSFENNTCMSVKLTNKEKLLLSTKLSTNNKDDDLYSTYEFDSGDAIKLSLDFKSEESNMQAKGSCSVTISRVYDYILDTPVSPLQHW